MWVNQPVEVTLFSTYLGTDKGRVDTRDSRKEPSDLTGTCSSLHVIRVDSVVSSPDLSQSNDPRITDDTNSKSFGIRCPCTVGGLEIQDGDKG